MTSNSVSTIGLQIQSLANLQSQQTTLAQLNEQLASGQQHDNLTQYDPTSAKNLMDFQNSITQNQAYISGMQTVTTRLNLYNQTMGDMENIAAQAQTLASSNQTLDPTSVSQLQAQAQDYLKQLTDDLNQQIGGRYIYSGTRYTTAPVIDLSTLTTAPTIPFTPTTSPTLPAYDSEYNPPTTTTDPAAFAQDSVAIDSASSITYGVTSNNPSIQQLVAGLQFINAATQPGTSATDYKTDMQQANSLLTTALSGVQSLNSGVASNINILANQTSLQNSDISNLQNQISNLQQVNLTQVGTEIDTLQTQLQASYSATATVEQLSILKYL